MGNVNSSFVALGLNAPLIQNQGQDENRSDSETQTIMDENVLASVNKLYEEYAQLLDVDQLSTLLNNLSEERSSYDLNLDDPEVALVSEEETERVMFLLANGITHVAETSRSEDQAPPAEDKHVPSSESLQPLFMDSSDRSDHFINVKREVENTINQEEQKQNQKFKAEVGEPEMGLHSQMTSEQKQEYLRTISDLEKTSKQEKAQIQKIETENGNLRSKIQDLEDIIKKLHFREEELEHINVLRNSNQSHLEAQIKELDAKIENNVKKLKMIELEELLTIQQTRAEDLQKKKFHLEKSSQLEKMVLEARNRETEMKKDEQNSKIEELEEVITNLQSTVQEHLRTISIYEEEISQTRSEANTQLEIQRQEAQKENAKKITDLESRLQRRETMIADLRFEMVKKDAEINEKTSTITELEQELADLLHREHELLTTVSRLEPQIENAETENHNLKTELRKCEEIVSSMKQAGIKSLESVQSREQEHLKTMSDLETNSQKGKTLFKAEVQVTSAVRKVKLEYSVDDEKEIIPSKSQADGNNTAEKWKKGLLIGGGCVAAAVALWKYGPDVAGIASALNQPRLFGNLF